MRRDSGLAAAAEWFRAATTRNTARGRRHGAYLEERNRMAKKKTSSASKSGVIKSRSKSEVFSAVADETGLAKRDIAAVFSALENQIKKDLSARGPGVFSVPGLMKIQVRKKPATKAIKGWTNPFTGEKQDKPARPASKTVKIRPLKKLKEMV